MSTQCAMCGEPTAPPPSAICDPCAQRIGVMPISDPRAFAAVQVARVIAWINDPALNRAAALRYAEGLLAELEGPKRVYRPSLGRRGGYQDPRSDD